MAYESPARPPQYVGNVIVSQTVVLAYTCKYMPQLTIYLDQETERLVRDASRQAGEPASKWVADAIRRRVSHEWPADVLAILGTWPNDFPETDSLRTGLGDDAPREPL